MKKFLLGLFPILSICLLALPATANMIPQRSVLANGMILLTSEQRALPMVSIELLIDAGSRHDVPKQEGLANLTARLLTYGTQRRTALQISDTLDFIGAGLSAGCGEDLASVSMTVLKKDLATGLELLAEVLTAVDFSARRDRSPEAIDYCIHQSTRREPRRHCRAKIRGGALSTEPLRAAGGRKRSLGEGTGTAKPESLLRALLSTQSDDFVGGG